MFFTIQSKVFSVINQLYIFNLVTSVALATDFFFLNQVAGLTSSIFQILNLLCWRQGDDFSSVYVNFALFGDKYCLLVESYRSKVRKTTDGCKWENYNPENCYIWGYGESNTVVHLFILLSTNLIMMTNIEQEFNNWLLNEEFYATENIN